MISIIICSVDSRLKEQLSENIKATIGAEYEIIAIDNTSNTYSITQAYNLGAKQAQYPYLCFVHEDILFHTENWGRLVIKHLSTGKNALVGILGCLIKTLTPSGVYIPVERLNRVNQLQRRLDGGSDQYYENPFNEEHSQVITVDGLFMAVSKANHHRYLFDEDRLNGFHGYDVDYSLGQAANGKVVVVYDILIEHFSYGGNTRQWVDAQLSLTDKWKAQLPRHVSLNRQEIKAAEIVNIETFLITLYALRYKKQLQFKYLTILLRLRPLSAKNLYFIRKFLLGDTIDNGIKKLLKR